MTIIEVVEQVRELLRSKGRISYRILKMQFQLEDEQLEVLKEELIDIEELAVDKDGKMLVWTGEPAPSSAVSGEAVSSPQLSAAPQSQPPASYTPPHLAERILAEQAALALGQEVAHAWSFSFALVFAADFSLHCRAYARTHEHANTALAISAEHGFALWPAMASIFGGRALAAQGQLSEGIAQIQQGIEAFQAIRADGVFLPHYWGLLADTYRQAGQPDEGLRTVADALAIVDKTEERWHEAELYRLKGELLLQLRVKSEKLRVQEEAEECFHKALEVARRQQAKSWELRAAMSLARLWQSQGKKAEARQMLAEIYNWFTEGFDTADLKDAKALLETLS